MKFLRVNKNRKCPVCHHADWCGISDDGNVAACMRVTSDKQAKNGAWLHFLTDDRKQKTAVKISLKPTITPPIVQRSPEDIDEVYRAFLDNLVLAKEHAQDLRARGLEEGAIFLHGYKSMPTLFFAANICARLSKDYDLRGVPGFYRKFDSWLFIDYKRASGYLIPIRNRQHQICALQLRRDDNRSPKYLIVSSGWQADGTPSGTPAHFATLGNPLKRELIRGIIITEGVLKANVIAEYTEKPIVGLLSVTTFNETFPVQLKEAFPNLEKAQIAFDMDAITNEAVKAQRFRLVKTLSDASIKATILTWDREFKGLDDYLVSRTANRKTIAA